MKTIVSPLEFCYGHMFERLVPIIIACYPYCVCGRVAHQGIEPMRFEFHFIEKLLHIPFAYYAIEHSSVFFVQLIKKRHSPPLSIRRAIPHYRLPNAAGRCNVVFLKIRTPRSRLDCRLRASVPLVHSDFYQPYYRMRGKQRGIIVSSDCDSEDTTRILCPCGTR